jgi:lantibiotic modifying enzyme
MLTGFAHGAAGIACQLARLAQAGAGAGFLAAARDAITYEQSLFDSKIGNWPDLRAPSPNLPAFSCSWCHGAPGIALSRAAWVSAFGEAELLPQIEAGLQTTLRFGSDEVDSLCCGNAGRIDILVSLAARLGRPALLERAQHLAAAALAKKIAAGDWRYLWQLPRGVFHPTLFQGAAGIGYTLLRLALPGRLPSILLME